MIEHPLEIEQRQVGCRLDVAFLENLFSRNCGIVTTR